MNTILLNPDDIVLDDSLQTRVDVNHDVVADYADALSRGDKLPPVKVCLIFDKYWCVDGFHSVLALHRANMQVEAIVVDKVKDPKAALAYAVAANRDHGLQRTPEDKAKVVELVLKDERWSNWANERIANLIGIGHDTIRIIRNRLIKEGKIKETKLIDRRGVERPAANIVRPADNTIENRLPIAYVRAITAAREPCVRKMEAILGKTPSLSKENVWPTRILKSIVREKPDDIKRIASLVDKGWRASKAMRYARATPMLQGINEQTTLKELLDIYNSRLLARRELSWPLFL